MSIFESKACKKTGIARVQKKTNPFLRKLVSSRIFFSLGFLFLRPTQVAVSRIEELPYIGLQVK